MRDWNSSDQFSFSLIVSNKSEREIEDSKNPMNSLLKSLKKSKTVNQERAVHLVTHYEAFDESTNLI